MKLHFENKENNNYYYEYILFYLNLLEKISENSFSRCSSLKEIKFPQNLKEINSVAFSHTPLKEIIFPKNIRIIHLGFLFCTSLKKIIIPKRFKNDIKDIFFGVDLTKVNITYI